MSAFNCVDIQKLLLISNNISHYMPVHEEVVLNMLQAGIYSGLHYCMLIAASLCLSAQNTSCSSMDDFECGNGDCIKYTLTCDGMAHCKDKSDEKQSYCSECDILNLHGGYEGLPLLSVCVCVQLTVCVRRAISAVWTDAVSDTSPGVTGAMIAGITLMSSSVMVSHYILNIFNAADFEFYSFQSSWCCTVLFSPSCSITAGAGVLVFWIVKHFGSTDVDVKPAKYVKMKHEKSILYGWTIIFCPKIKAKLEPIMILNIWSVSLSSGWYFCML